MCGKVTYTIDAAPLRMYHCHCSICRAASGASFVTNIAVATANFHITAGEGVLSAFESSPGKRRYFCSACGSPIYSHGRKTSHYVSVRCGTLKDDPGVHPAYHAYAGSKAAWVTIGDELPQFEAARE
jgi:hypothetical protein